ncbi:MarR family winged helix-turn-helix transcriptional regulator [Lysobacter korlensis]|uniref:MarR family winged helix-turn-helix transcriptional regulator n=1 Tax=Lysobacter korlensis TaxID=553636 RepID=A0ABV6RZ17_9GAMM
METETAGTSQPQWNVAAPTILLREFLSVSEDFERRLGRELEVNPTDLAAMEHLIQSGPLSPSDIAARLGVTTAAATTIVDRLAKVGHVSRRSNEQDRRGVLVVPEPESVRRALGVIQPMVQAVDGALRDFDDAEQRAITAYLHRVLEIYRSYAYGNGPA